MGLDRQLSIGLSDDNDDLRGNSNSYTVVTGGLEPWYQCEMRARITKNHANTGKQTSQP